MLPRVIPGMPFAEQEERATCMVRTLLAYETRTRRVRKRFSPQEMTQNSLFFIGYKPGFYRPIHPSTSSRWIKDAVVWVYISTARSKKDFIYIQSKHNQVRGIAASFALFTNVILSEILDAVM